MKNKYQRDKDKWFKKNNKRLLDEFMEAYEDEWLDFVDYTFEEELEEIEK